MNIGTHSGVFHADDVFAVALLLKVAPSATITRTRDPQVLAKCGILVDVGGVHDGETKFDHHQKERAGSRPNGVFFSSFGLVWKVFGPQFCETEEAFDQVDFTLVQPIDALDNGQSLYEGGVEKFLGVSGYSLSAAISTFNPSWDSKKDFDGRFYNAASFARDILESEIAAANASVKARRIVMSAISANPDSPIVLLNKFCPWAETVVPCSPEALFCVFPSEEGTWMVQAVPQKLGGFESRKLLPEPWRGLRDQAFAEVTGIPDGVFCHPGRFICGARTRESAVKLAEMAIKA